MSAQKNPDLHSRTGAVRFYGSSALGVEPFYETQLRQLQSV